MLNSHVYTLKHLGLASYTIAASHIHSWLSSVRIAVEIIFTTLVSLTEMLPSPTRLEPRYEVTHTDSDGNTMKKRLGSVLLRLQPR